MDAPSLLTFQITEEDIAKGVRMNCYVCPVSQAVKRVYKPLNVITCIEYDTRLWVSIDTYGWYALYTSDEATAELIKHYDKTGELKPCEITLTRKGVTNG